MAGNNFLKLQLNTPTSITRDLKVELTNQVTGEKRQATPYLDGTVTVPNLIAGDWRVQVKHPNMVFDVFDKPVKVLPDRPTITPIIIPTNIFENVAIRDIPDADLSPVQQRLDESAAAAERQGNKRAGQPIYADDWNELSQTVVAVARSTREMTTLVAPQGHNHPELEDKFTEVQRNLQRMFDAFGSSLAQIQRQIQQLALQNKVETAIEKVPNLPADIRGQLMRPVSELQEVWSESPGIYTNIKRRAGQQVLDNMSEVLAGQNADVRNDPAVVELLDFTRAMATEAPARTFEEEIQQQQRTTKSSTTGLVFDALKSTRLRS